MPRRTTSSTKVEYASLEPRAMLAGGVFVDMVGQDLVICGNPQSNVFEVDLDATTSAELVTGQAETRIRFSEDFDSGVDLSSVRDVRIYTGPGDDVVTIFGEGFVASDDLTISLGHGHDSLYFQDGEFQDDVRIFGGDNHDSVSLTNMKVGGGLGIFTNMGTDVVGLNGVNVQAQTRLFGQAGHDKFLVNESSFKQAVYVEMGQGADRYNAVENEFDGLLSIRGRQGADFVFLEDSNTLGSTAHLHTTEQRATQPSNADAAIEQVKSGFFEFGNQLMVSDSEVVQNSLTQLADAFDSSLISLGLNPSTQTVSVEDPTPTISVLWDSVVQSAVETTGPGPTIASRAYGMLHTAMYDAWSAYDPTAISTSIADTLQRPTSENTLENKTEAMSFAAFRILDDLFSTESVSFENLMNQLGYDPANMTTDITTAAGIGNRMAAELLTMRHADGANQLGDSSAGSAGVSYSDTTNYLPTNPVGNADVIDLWTPEFVPIDATPGNEDRFQVFLTPHWGTVTPFGIATSDEFRPAAPEPFLLVDGTVDLDSQTITLNDNSVVDIDKSLIGTIINPKFISQAEEVVEISANLTDQEKLIAEFWEDGGGTSFPPGTFMTFGEFVSARDNHSLDDDAKMFFALGNSVFDAGVATWEAKVHYDYVRPVRAIRDLGELGLLGQYDATRGGYTIEAWTPNNGTQTILATEFLTYQTPGSDPSPPFSEYTSGHSAFSAAGATILELFTGSDEFGASVTFDSGESRFEPGLTPELETVLTWETFSAAADEAGVSRLYGGIHFTDGDINGRTLGEQVGNAVWQKTLFYVNGGV